MLWPLVQVVACRVRILRRVPGMEHIRHYNLLVGIESIRWLQAQAEQDPHMEQVQAIVRHHRTLQRHRLVAVIHLRRRRMV